ncbi:MAG: hypothetical protein AB7G39_14580 [Alphaproteobacteria bacterium]
MIVTATGLSVAAAGYSLMRSTYRRYPRPVSRRDRRWYSPRNLGRYGGGYLLFMGGMWLVEGLAGQAFSYHFVFEIILGLTALAMTLLLLQHELYNRREAILTRMRRRTVHARAVVTAAAGPDAGRIDHQARPANDNLSNRPFIPASNDNGDRHHGHG